MSMLVHVWCMCVCACVVLTLEVIDPLETCEDTESENEIREDQPSHHAPEHIIIRGIPLILHILVDGNGESAGGIVDGRAPGGQCVWVVEVTLELRENNSDNCLGDGVHVVEPLPPGGDIDGADEETAEEEEQCVECAGQLDGHDEIRQERGGQLTEGRFDQHDDTDGTPELEEQLSVVLVADHEGGDVN